MGKPIITRIEVKDFEHEVRDRTAEGIYEPGTVSMARGNALRIFTDTGLIGEFVSGSWDFSAIPPGTIQVLIGMNALEREKVYLYIKQRDRQRARLDMGRIDIALWDLAGKYYNAPVYELLGGHRNKLPCYASTLHGDFSEGGLNSPEAYADFAEQCLEMGYPGFKMHSWYSGVPLKQEIALVHAVGKRVGGKMDLMLDPGCVYYTFADVLKVGKACDEEGFFWYEDPGRDGGISQFAHRKLRHFIKTPLLLTEMVASLEPTVDFALADATDFLRATATTDGGITGVMKIAHAAEGLGIDIELHGPGPAHRHCMAAIRNSNYYEVLPVHPKLPLTGRLPIYKSDYWDGLGTIDKDGYVNVPEGPGLGVEYDWDFIMKHCTGNIEYK